MFLCSAGVASPLGLGWDTSVDAWLAGASGLRPFDKDGLHLDRAGVVPGFRPRKQLPDRKAVKLMSRIQQLFGRRLSPAALFQNPTVEGLALQLRGEESPAESAALVPIQAEGRHPPMSAGRHQAKRHVCRNTSSSTTAGQIWHLGHRRKRRAACRLTSPMPPEILRTALSRAKGDGRCGILPVQPGHHPGGRRPLREYARPANQFSPFRCVSDRTGNPRPGHRRQQSGH